MKTTFDIVAVYHPPDSSSFSNKFLICLLFIKYLWNLHSSEYHSLCAPFKQWRQEFRGSVWRFKKLLGNVVFDYVLMCGAKLACWNSYVLLLWCILHKDYVIHDEINSEDTSLLSENTTDCEEAHAPKLNFWFRNVAKTSTKIMKVFQLVSWNSYVVDWKILRDINSY